MGMPQETKNALKPGQWHADKGGIFIGTFDLFDKLRSGHAIGKHVIAPLAVVEAIHNLKNTGEYKRMSDGGLPGKLITTLSGTGVAHWQWSCTPYRNTPANVRTFGFTDGYVDWAYRDTNRLLGRACFAELAP